MSTQHTGFVLVHADESCLGNQNAGASRGGAGGLIEIRSGDAVVRRDLFFSSPDTTNNRMALEGAIAVLDRLAAKGARLHVLYYSDSQYLVKGVSEWMPGWKSRGWRRKAGPIENLQLWQALDRSTHQHRVDFRWVRGHAGHAKNEYVDHLAVSAATDQTDSHGLVSSELDAWLAERAAKGQFSDFDPDRHFENLECQPQQTS